jgi:aminopeptidase YwaD
MPANPATPTPKPAKPASFSVSRVLADTQAIEDLGRRVAGGSQEKAAADYVAARLRSMGYKVTIQKFNVPGGVSRNVTAHVAGDDPRVLVVGGHLDTRPTTPGANDNALGCAMVLEMARIFATEKPPVSLELTMFGAEEYNDGTPRDHHRGSRYHVAHMTKAQRARTIGMISIDVVGYGSRLYTRTMRIGPMTMSDYLLHRAKKLGVELSYSKDPGPTGWSDHEPYEKAGIPAVWLERLQDPQYHKPGDTTAHLQPSAVKAAGRLVLDAIRSLDAAEATAIRGGAGDTSGE